MRGYDQGWDAARAEQVAESGALAVGQSEVEQGEIERTRATDRLAALPERSALDDDGALLDQDIVNGAADVGIVLHDEDHRAPRRRLARLLLAH